jgi:hypothetical protein
VIAGSSTRKKCDMEVIKCKNCPEEIEQLPSGTWTNRDGFCYCKKQLPGEAPMLHEPIISPEWRNNIKVMARNAFWSPTRLAQLYQLSATQIQEILDS